MDEFEQKFNDLKNHVSATASTSNKNFTANTIVDSGIKEEKVSSDAKIITLAKTHTAKDPMVLMNDGVKFILKTEKDIPAGVKVELGSTHMIGSRHYINGRVLPEKSNIDLYNKKMSHMESQKSSNEVAIVLLILFLIIIAFVVAPIFFDFIMDEVFTELDFDTALNKKLYM